METETFQSLVFMIFGLGFFLFVILILTRDHREASERRLMEAREFGLKDPVPTETPDRSKKEE